MSDETIKKELHSVDTNTMPWTEFYVEQLKAGFPIKGLFQTQTLVCPSRR